MKYMKSFLVLLLVSVLACSFASALSIDTVKIDGDELSSVATNYIEKDDEYDVRVVFSSGINESYEDAQVRVYLSGVDEDYSVEDSTDTFDIEQSTQYVKKLTLKLSHRLEKDDYVLYVRVEDREGTIEDTENYELKVRSEKHAIEIRDIILSPENEVKAGRALLATARIKNRGTEDEEDLKVKASIPALGISASDYVDELGYEDCDEGDSDCDDSTTSEELYMRIPDCAEPGEYTVRVCVEYDDGDEEECGTTKINVVESDTCNVPAETPTTTGKTIITIGPETQDIAKGGSAMYPVTIANQGMESKVYSISVDSADWADFSVTPSNVLVVGAGESKAAYVSVNAKSTASGLQVFSVTIKSGESVLKQVPLRANIGGGAAATTNLGRIKRALEVGLIVLVVLLVVLGLIIGFNKLKGSEEETEGEEKTYY